MAIHTYIIDCDIYPKYNTEYMDFYNAIQALGIHHWKFLEDTWMITSEKNATEIRDELVRNMKPGDRLVVVRAGGEAAWANFEEFASNWLDTYINQTT